MIALGLSHFYAGNIYPRTNLYFTPTSATRADAGEEATNGSRRQTQRHQHYLTQIYSGAVSDDVTREIGWDTNYSNAGIFPKTETN